MGTYLINYMVIGSGQNNHIYLTSIFINSINKYNCETHKKMAAGGDVITQTGTCLLDISAGEVISLRTVDISGGGSGDYYGGNLDIIQVGIKLILELFTILMIISLILIALGYFIEIDILKILAFSYICCCYCFN